MAANGAARQLGVAPGMGLASAWGLAPELKVTERDGAAETRALAGLACWGGNFTPQVSLDPPAGLLLEIGGCLRLFGGLPALLQQAVDGALAQGYSLAAACAPTPLAARWLANGAPWLEPAAAGAQSADEPLLAEAGGPLPVCADPVRLGAALAPLALDCLELPRAQQQRLENFGVDCLGDLLALPRAGLNRRLGLQLAADLARALGEVPDPRPRFPFPDTFRQGLELPARVDDAPALNFAARRLLQQLQGWLASRGAGVGRCTLELQHEKYAGSTRRGLPPTRLVLGFAGLTRDGERLQRVLSERLGRLALAAPVDALTLIADQVEELPGSDRQLPGQAPPEEEGTDPARTAVALERIKARLGEDKVYSLAAVPDHRPEQATRRCAPNLDLQGIMARAQDSRHSQAMAGQGPRPLWLLAHPLALGETQGRPRHGGPLQLLAGPERIESGWWDEGESADGLPAPGDLRRDYFVARNPAGEWLWVFRDESGWFLHGRFA